MAYAGLLDRLVIAHAGIGFPHPDDPVQDVLPVVTLIQRQVMLFQPSGNRRNRYRIQTLPQHWQHTDASGRKAHTSSLG